MTGDCRKQCHRAGMLFLTEHPRAKSPGGTKTGEYLWLTVHIFIFAKCIKLKYTIFKKSSSDGLIFGLVSNEEQGLENAQPDELTGQHNCRHEQTVKKAQRI